MTKSPDIQARLDAEAHHWHALKAADAEFLRSHLGDKTSTISIYRGRSAMRRVQIFGDYIEVYAGGQWRGAFVNPGGLRELVVRS